METENQSSTEMAISNLSANTKVLSIGDSQQSHSSTKIASKNRPSNIDEEFRKHLAYLLLGSRKSLEVDDNWNMIGRFEMDSVKEKNKPRRYVFNFGNKCGNGSIISGPTLCGREVMDEVRRRLRDENWISENEIETPLKTKAGKEYYNSDSYMQHIVSESMNAEHGRLLKYILQLHTEYVRQTSKGN